MKMFSKVSIFVSSIVLCLALAACNSAPAEPTAVPSATPIVSPTSTDNPDASPAIDSNNNGEPSTGTAAELTGKWLGTGDTAGANLDFESAALVSFTFVDVAADEVFSYSGPVAVENGNIIITDKTTGEDVSLPYSIKGNIITITHNELQLTLEKQ